MGVDFLYKNAAGRGFLKVAQTLGIYKAGAWFMKRRASKFMISYYINKYEIDMTPFEGQTYNSFSDFFCRTKEQYDFDERENAFISPCDGLFSYYRISDDMNIPMKGSSYRLEDIVPCKETAELFNDGLFMVFRLRANDYHHFCSFDNMTLEETHYIPGQLHSVQPIACETVPVYRLNRRWWSVLSTKNFQTVAQIEVGAMMVGGVTFAKENGDFAKGEEMGNFELAGSTIVILLNSDVREKLTIGEKFLKASGGECEVAILMGETLGLLKNEVN